MANKSKTFYKVRSADNVAPKARIITKFNSDLDVLSSYHMTWFEGSNKGYYDCACPATKFDCRHKTILAKIEASKKVDSEEFYCFETNEFLRPEEVT